MEINNQYDFFKNINIGDDGSIGVNIVSGGTSTSGLYVETATNYTDLLTKTGTYTNGDLAYVYNDEGTKWLPGTIGGSYYPDGTYVYSGTTWTSNRNAISVELNSLPDITDFVFVNDKEDFPTPSSGVITLLDDVTYFVTDDIDLTGDRLVGGSDTTILGGSSENCSLTSTGLGTGVALFTTEWTTPIRHITFKDVDTAIHIDGNTNPPLALDWTGVNFLNVPNVGMINTCDNWIYSKGAFLNSTNLRFSGSTGTIGIDNSIFVGTGAPDPILDITDNAVITRRFRSIYSSFVVFGATSGINVSTGSTIPTEGYILDTINFSAGGDYLTGLDGTSNKSLFIKCVGIENTFVNGQMYMIDNLTRTEITGTTNFTKILGTTTPSIDNSKYNHSNNRLTCNAEIERKYLIQCNLSYQINDVTLALDEGFESGNFTANSWSVVNDTTNQWVVGTADTETGIYSSYVSDDGGVTPEYDNTISQVSHFYKDITFSSGATNIILSFDWKCGGEDGGSRTSWDYGAVVITDTTDTITSGSEVITTQASAGGNGRIGATTNDGKFNLDYGTNPETTWNNESIDLTSYAGTTKRLVFTWKNDSSAGINPSILIDNIQILDSDPNVGQDTCLFGFYDSKLGDIREPSKIKSTPSALGKSENISTNCVVSHSNGDYIEMHVKNSSNTNDVIVTDLNVLITEIG
jgi:hypothetical protein